MSAMANPAQLSAQAFVRPKVDIRRRRIWLIVLLVGFWLARPYHLPWTAAEERDADTAALASNGSIDRQVAMPALALLGIYMLYRSREQRERRRFKGRLGLAAGAYCALCTVSILWSADPFITLKRAVVFALSVLLVIAMAKVYTAIELAEVGFYACGAVAAIAILVDIFVSKAFAPFDPEYRFLGVMSSNSQGQNLTVCIFCGLTLMLSFPRHTRWIAPCLGLAVVLLFLTRSRTATFTCLLLALFFFKRQLEARFKPQTLLIATLLCLGVIAPLLIASGGGTRIAESSFMLGREDTQNTASLSNRTPLWAELSGFVSERPILGYGYNSFWTMETISDISRHQGWGVPNGHNTYLDQQLSVGVFGVVLFTMVFWGTLFRAWARYRRHPDAESLLAPVMLTWLFVTSFVETVPLDPFLPTFLVYVFIAQCLMPESVGAPHPTFMTEDCTVPAQIGPLPAGRLAG